jgi:hypothetical protein
MLRLLDGAGRRTLRSSPVSDVFQGSDDDSDYSPRKNQATDKAAFNQQVSADRGNKIEKLKSVQVRRLTRLDTAFVSAW